MKTLHNSILASCEILWWVSIYIKCYIPELSVTPWSPSISEIDKNELDDKARSVEGQMNVRGDREEVRMCFRSPALLPNNRRVCGGTI